MTEITSMHKYEQIPNAVVVTDAEELAPDAPPTNSAPPAYSSCTASTDTKSVEDERRKKKRQVRGAAVAGGVAVLLIGGPCLALEVTCSVSSISCSSINSEEASPTRVCDAVVDSVR